MNQREQENSFPSTGQPEKKQALFIGGPAVIFRWKPDREGTVEYVSSNVSQFGYQPEMFTTGKMTYADMVHPDDRARVFDEAVRNYSSGVDAFEQNYRILRVNGDVCWVYDYTEIEKNSRGGILSYYGYILDMTERKKINDSLFLERELLRTLADNIPDSIYFKNIDSQFTQINNHQAKILGLSRPEEAIGKTDFDFFEPAHAQQAFQDEQEIIKTGKPLVGKIERVRFFDGSFRWMTVTKMPIQNPEGVIIGVAGISRDITEMKEMMESLQKSEEKLHRRLAMEELMTALSTQFVSTPPEKIDHEIERALQSIGEFARSDRNYLVLFTKDQKMIDRVYGWHAGHIRSLSREITGISLEPFTWVMKKLDRRETIYIRQTFDLPPEAESERRLFQILSIQSILGVPLIIHGKLIGLFGLCSETSDIHWGEEDLRFFKTMGEIFVNALERKWAEETLRESEKRYRGIFETVADGIIVLDVETGTVQDVNTATCKMYGYTREEMLRFRIVDFSAESEATIQAFKIGLNYIPLRFHKKKDGTVFPVELSTNSFIINNREGDRLLIRFAQIVKKVCRKEDVIARWGGDEFIILLPRTAGEQVAEIMNRIWASCQETKNDPFPLSIALGYSVKEQVGQDRDKIIQEVEDRMYRNKLTESQSARHVLISSLEHSLRETTHETETHAQRLRQLAHQMGVTMRLSQSNMDELDLLARLHDLGKIAISRDILESPDPLTPEKWEIIKKHPEIGYRIAASSQGLIPIADSILAHHERWDGTGYPRGLKENNIPLAARMITIVDAFDVMIQGRPYKKAVTVSQAMEELKRCAGSQFDPELVEVFIQTIEEKNETNKVLTGY
ncbi:MAG: PAS domain S-box protein [Candidatus Atribacteria bacterium]|nr:PAS domain S-box protein [Candidatus Atribacteria bacterium]